MMFVCYCNNNDITSYAGSRKDADSGSWLEADSQAAFKWNESEQILHKKHPSNKEGKLLGHMKGR